MLVIDKDSNILTKNGYKAAKDLTLEDKIISTGETVIFEEYAIKAIKECKNRELIKVKVAEGSVYLHKDTMILCKGGQRGAEFKYVGDLKENDYVGLYVERNIEHLDKIDMRIAVREKEHTIENYADESFECVERQYISNNLRRYIYDKCFWWLCGVYLAKGYIAEDKAIIYDTSNLNNVEMCLNKLNIKYKYNKVHQDEIIKIEDSIINAFLQEKIGMKAGLKVVNPIFMRLPYEELHSFIDGWSSMKKWEKQEDGNENTIIPNMQVALGMQICYEKLNNIYAKVNKKRVDVSDIYDEELVIFEIKEGKENNTNNNELKQYWTKVEKIEKEGVEDSFEIKCVNSSEYTLDATCYVNNFIVF